VAGAEGQAILDQFDSKLPFIKALAKKCESVAKERGYIKTLSGRRCRFPREGNKWGWTHKALNRLIQGSSADQTKKAVVDADAAGLFLQIQVHDEIDGSFGTEAEAIRLAEVMRDTYKLRVPMKVDVEIGPSWGEAKKIDRCVI
jgi:DNA polymerase I-like protein with 3'-5' exonuclease and polymerase domains